MCQLWLSTFIEIVTFLCLPKRPSGAGKQSSADNSKVMGAVLHIKHTAPMDRIYMTTLRVVFDMLSLQSGMRVVKVVFRGGSDLSQGEFPLPKTMTFSETKVIIKLKIRLRDRRTMMAIFIFFLNYSLMLMNPSKKVLLNF